MENRLLRPNDILKVEDILLFRYRFRKDKYAIMKVTEIFQDAHVYFYAKCIKSSNSYREGSEVGCDFRAHTNHKYAVELTYVMPVANLLYGKNNV